MAIVACGHHLRRLLYQIEDVLDRIRGPIYYRTDIGNKFLHQSWFNEKARMIDYEEAGVNLAEAQRSMKTIAPIVKSTQDERVISRPNGFTGLFVQDSDSPDVLVSTMDGVGTKSKIVLQSLGKSPCLSSRQLPKQKNR